jgi:hypothetical protein
VTRRSRGREVPGRPSCPGDRSRSWQALRVITPATKIRTNPCSRFGPATADRGSRGIRDQPRNPPKYTEKRIRINFPFPCPSVLPTVKIFEACADFLTPDGLGSCSKQVGCVAKTHREAERCVIASSTHPTTGSYERRLRLGRAAFSVVTRL